MLSSEEADGSVDVDITESESQRRGLLRAEDGISPIRARNDYEIPDNITAPRHNTLYRKFLLFSIATTAALGGILFGYDIGVISGALLQLRRDFHLSCDQQSIVVSFLLLGAAIGALISGFLVDFLGRWITIMLNGFIFILGSLTISLAQSFHVLIIGRLLVGFAVSVFSVAECVYISEISPAKKRGQFVSLNEFGITLGLLLSYLVNFLYINVPHGWRYMFGLSCIIAILQILLTFFLPQSPRFLILKGKETQAAAVLRYFHNDVDTEEEINNIKTAIVQEKSSSWKDLFRSRGNVRKLFLLGFGLVTFQQFTGQSNLLYYAPIVFRLVGFPSDESATLATLGLGTVKVSVAIVALLCVDQWGRRLLLMIGISTMSICLVVLSIGTWLQEDPSSSFEMCQSWHYSSDSNKFPSINSSLSSSSNESFIHYSRKKRELIPSSVPHIVTSVKFLCQSEIAREKKDEHTHSYSNLSDIIKQTFNHSSSYGQKTSKEISQGKTSMETNNQHIIHILTLLALMAYVAAYGISFGPITWILLSEIYPPSIRGRAVGVVLIINWTSNFIVSSSFLHTIDLITLPATFFLFAVISSFALLFVFFYIPETKNKTLEEIAYELSIMRPRLPPGKSHLRCCSHLCRHSYSRVSIEEIQYKLEQRPELHDII